MLNFVNSKDSGVEDSERTEDTKRVDLTSATVSM